MGASESPPGCKHESPCTLNTIRMDYRPSEGVSGLIPFDFLDKIKDGEGAHRYGRGEIIKRTGMRLYLVIN